MYNTCSVKEAGLARLFHRLEVHTELAAMAILAKSDIIANVELAMVKGILGTLHILTNTR